MNKAIDTRHHCLIENYPDVAIFYQQKWHGVNVLIIEKHPSELTLNTIVKQFIARKQLQFKVL